MRLTGSWEQYQQKCRDDAVLEALRAGAADALGYGAPASAEALDATDNDESPDYEEIPYSHQVELINGSPTAVRGHLCSAACG